MRSLIVAAIAVTCAACGSTVDAPASLLDSSGDSDSQTVDDSGDTAPADSDPGVAATDNEPGDGMPIDADPGPPPCTALLCDDFEASSSIDATKWDVVSVGYAAGISMTVQQATVKTGLNAAHGHLLNDQGGFAILQNHGLFPQLKDELWGRVNFYTTVAPSAGHTGFISAYADAYRLLEIGYSGGKWQTTRYFMDASGFHEFPRGSVHQVPLNTWTCLEWHFNRLAPSGGAFIELYVDGTLAESYASAGESLDAMAGVGVGIDDHSANPPSEDVYLDDVAIDDARIGCLP